MRILHISDLHLTVDWRRLPLPAWLGKRLLGGLNFLLGRGRAYNQANAKIALLDRFRQEQAIDFVIVTGDYTAFGSEIELAHAAEHTAPLREAPLGFATLPGNHDLYVGDTARAKRFEHYFGPWMTTDLPEHLVPDGPWPWVRLLGDDVAIVAVNSALPRPLWSSSGRIPDAQLHALARVLRDERVASRFVFVTTHYAARIEDGRRDEKRHALENADAFLDVVKDVPRGALLSGHVHRRFSTPIDGVRPPLFCAGSSTKEGREGLWVFETLGDGVLATPGDLHDGAYRLSPADAVALPRPPA